MKRPITGLDQCDPEHEAESTRQVAGRVFVASLRDRMAVDATRGWSDLPAAPVLYDVARTYRWNDPEGDGLSPIQSEIKHFADLYGWPDTLRAIAQAMDDDEQARRELMDRR